MPSAPQPNKTQGVVLFGLDATGGKGGGSGGGGLMEAHDAGDAAPREEYFQNHTKGWRQT